MRLQLRSVFVGLMLACCAAPAPAQNDPTSAIAAKLFHLLKPPVNKPPEPASSGAPTVAGQGGGAMPGLPCGNPGTPSGTATGPADLGAMFAMRKANELAAKGQYSGRAFSGTGTVVKVDSNPLMNIGVNPIYGIVIDFGKHNGSLQCVGNIPTGPKSCGQDPSPLRPGLTVHVDGRLAGPVDWADLGYCHWEIVAPGSDGDAANIHPTYARAADLTVSYGEMLGDTGNQIRFQQKYPIGKTLRVTGLQVGTITSTKLIMNTGSPVPRMTCHLRPSEISKAANLKPDTELAIAGTFAQPDRTEVGMWALHDCTFDIAE